MIQLVTAERRRRAKYCVGAVVTAFLLRVLACTLAARPFNSDTDAYFTQASQILQGRWQPFFPVGYPLLVAAAMCIAPHHLPGALLTLNVVASTPLVRL